MPDSGRFVVHQARIAPVIIKLGWFCGRDRGSGPRERTPFGPTRHAAELMAEIRLLALRCGVAVLILEPVCRAGTQAEYAGEERANGGDGDYNDA